MSANNRWQRPIWLQLARLVHCCALLKHLPPELPFCCEILMECKFLVNHTRSIGEIRSCSKCRNTYVIAHMTFTPLLLLFVQHCHVMTLFLGNRGKSVTGRACEAAIRIVLVAGQTVGCMIPASGPKGRGVHGPTH